MFKESIFFGSIFGESTFLDYTFFEKLFWKLIEMSLMASFCVAVICVIRLFLKKAPKIYSYLLWSIVALRLICPFGVESSFSLFNLPGVQKAFDVVFPDEMKSADGNTDDENISELSTPNGNGLDLLIIVRKFLNMPLTIQPLPIWQYLYRIPLIPKGQSLRILLLNLL